MTDREKLLQEAARRQLEWLRSRPRPAHDMPDLTARFASAHEALAAGVQALARLLQDLQGRNDYIELSE